MNIAKTISRRRRRLPIGPPGVLVQWADADRDQISVHCERCGIGGYEPWHRGRVYWGWGHRSVCAERPWEDIQARIVEWARSLRRGENGFANYIAAQDLDLAVRRFGKSPLTFSQFMELLQLQDENWAKWRERFEKSKAERKL